MKLADWLKANHYLPSTVRGTVQGVARAKMAFAAGQPIPDSCKPHMPRVLKYAEDNPQARELAPDFLAWVRDQGMTAAERVPSAKPKKRKRLAISLDQERWVKLRKLLEKSHKHEDLVLHVVYRSGLRIGDVLRIPAPELKKGLQAGVFDLERKGGTFIQVPVGANRDAWVRLFEAVNDRGAENVAHLLCRENPSPLPGDCAYKRAHRRLKEYQTKLGCEDSLHLHRLRRTIAVAALRATKGDLTKVQQMLGQKAIASTQRYTDELQAEGVAELQEGLFK